MGKMVSGTALFVPMIFFSPSLKASLSLWSDGANGRIVIHGREDKKDYGSENITWKLIAVRVITFSKGRVMT